jgi:threonine dehydratase
MGNSKSCPSVRYSLVMTRPADLVLADVVAAQQRLAPYIHHTPVLTSRTLDNLVGQRVFLKAENFQRGGSFKIRGATNCLAALPPEVRARGVVAFSSGNHAQGVALAARAFGVPATVVMPTDAPAAKVAAARSYGAQIATYDRQRDDREALAYQLAEATGATVIPPYDHYDVIAGQGTVALELLTEVGHLDALLVPVGGGGLLAGCATVAQAWSRSLAVYGVEAELANDTYLSFRAGQRLSIPPPATIADGMRNLTPGRLTFPILQRTVRDILLVSEDDIRAAVVFLLTRMKILVEPTGAVGLAALLAGKVPVQGGRVGVILSGGNIDTAQLADCLAGNRDHPLSNSSTMVHPNGQG